MSLKPGDIYIYAPEEGDPLRIVILLFGTGAGKYHTVALGTSSDDDDEIAFFEDPDAYRISSVTSTDETGTIKPKIPSWLKRYIVEGVFKD